MSGIRSKVADAVLRAKPYVVANKLSMASLALGMLDAAENKAIDIDKFLAFEDPDFRHDVHIFCNWDREKHRGLDEHCIPRSSVDEPETFMGIDLNKVCLEYKWNEDLVGGGKIHVAVVYGAQAQDRTKLQIQARQCGVLLLWNFGDSTGFQDLEAFINNTIDRHSSEHPDKLLVLCTHNTAIVNNYWLRPDCCFMYSGGRAVPFNKLTQKELRQEHNIEKMLRAGCFYLQGDW